MKITKKSRQIAGRRRWGCLARIALGPVCFLIVNNIPVSGLQSDGKIVLAVYAWIILWWIVQPIPWGITALLPLVILPMEGIMELQDVAALYGQRLLFFIIGVMLFGRAVQKHGLGKRMALIFLSGRWVGDTVYRILFVFLAAVAVLSAFIDDAAAIALGIPIGLSVVEYTTQTMNKYEGKQVKMHRLQTFMALGVLYAAEAGGITTVAGIPHIATAISVMEKTVHQSVSFIQWSQTGLVTGIVSFLAYFIVLRFFFPPEYKHIPGAGEFFMQEKSKLKPINSQECYVLVVFCIMLLFWITPVFFYVPFLDIWIVPVIGAMLLYILPSGETRSRGVLDAEDLKTLPWNVILLTLCGSTMASVTTDFGVIAWVQSKIPILLTNGFLPYIIGFITAGMSNFVSGVATVNIMGNVLFPLSNTLGLDVNVLVRILPAVGMAVIFPWAGAATGTAFSTGKIKISDMIKCGLVATILHVIVVVTTLLILTKILH